MSDTTIAVTAILLTLVLMFIFPLMTMADQKDKVVEMDVKLITEDFVENIRVTGKLTQDEYDNYILSLASTGGAYDVDITIQILDENLSKKDNSGGLRIGDDTRMEEYTSQVMEQLQASGVVTISEGSGITVDVTRVDTSIYEQLRNFLYKLTGNGDGNKIASVTGMVTKTGN